MQMVSFPSQNTTNRRLHCRIPNLIQRALVQPRKRSYFLNRTDLKDGVKVSESSLAGSSACPGKAGKDGEDQMV